MANSKKMKFSGKDTNNRETQGQSKESVMRSKQKELLRYSLDQILHAKKFRCLKEPLSTSNQMVNTIGLDGIDKKFNSYTRFDQFSDDIISVVRSYSTHSTDDAIVKSATDSLLELSQRDVKSIKTCPDCFEYYIIDRNNYFTRVCTKPHLLVFAKLATYPYWPAKVMSIEGNMANVEFFGEHTQADIPVAKCRLYSDKLVSNNSKNKELNESIKEFQRHVANIKEKFGSFHPAERKVTLKANDMEQQLMDMFPDAFKEEATTSNGSEEDATDAEEDNKEEPMDQERGDNHDESVDQNDDENLGEAVVIEYEDSEDLIMVNNEELENMSSPELTIKATVAEKESKGKESDEESEAENETHAEETAEEPEKVSVVEHEEESAMEQDEESEKESKTGTDEEQNEADGKGKRNDAKKTKMDSIEDDDGNYDESMVEKDDNTLDGTVIHEDDDHLDESIDDNEMPRKRPSDEVTVPDTFRKSAPSTNGPGKRATSVAQKDSPDETVPEETSSPDEAAAASSSSSKTNKIQTSRKRQRSDAKKPERDIDLVSKKRVRLSEVVRTLSANDDNAEGNTPSTSFLPEKLKRLEELEEKIQKLTEEKRELLRDIVTENKPSCATCKIPLDGPFFCSEQCQSKHK